MPQPWPGTLRAWGGPGRASFRVAWFYGLGSFTRAQPAVKPLAVGDPIHRTLIVVPSHAPIEPVGHLLAGAPQPGFERVLSDTEFLGRFTGGKTLHFAQHKRRPQQRGKLIQILPNHLVQFAPLVLLLGRGPMIGEPFDSRQLMFTRWLIERNCRPRLPASTAHQRRIDHDARQPGGKVRSSLEPR